MKTQQMLFNKSPTLFNKCHLLNNIEPLLNKVEGMLNKIHSILNKIDSRLFTFGLRLNKPEPILFNKHSTLHTKRCSFMSNARCVCANGRLWGGGSSFAAAFNLEEVAEQSPRLTRSLVLRGYLGKTSEKIRLNLEEVVAGWWFEPEPQPL